MPTFNPSRLRVARKRRLLNKTKFAAAIDVDVRTVTGYERGEYEPSPATLALIAKTLRFPAGFFAGDDLHEPVPATASFRSLARMSAANREAALASGALAFLLNDWIERRFTLPAPDVPDLREEDPDAAAMALRQQWGLGERPIRNVVHLLEAKGIRVFTLFEDTTEVDAFSLWRAATPFVFLNTMKSAERSRFDAAHELGHLVLHRHAGAPQGREAEHEANRFASAFLMPRGSVLAVAPVFPNLDRLVELKRQWIVSVGAIAYRLHALRLLTDWHYTRLCIEISERGFRTKEPQPAQREMSQVLPKVFAAFREEGTTLGDVADALQIDPEEIDKLVFRLMLIGLQGHSSMATISSRRAVLQVVK
jgi:Zn-dependent peptidase ImmA (M78 family)/DNA-binding XRE family transcriptional regulator